MARLTEADREYIKELRAKNILEDIDGHRLDVERGVVMVVCSDPYRRHDIFSHKERLIEPQCPNKLIFPITQPGGALRLAAHSPANDHGSSRHSDMLEDIKLGLEILRTQTVALYYHAPCALAASRAIDFITGIDILFRSKDYLKNKIKKIESENLGIKVACFVHIDRGGDMNTYFIRRHKYHPWRHNFPSSLRE